MQFFNKICILKNIWYLCLYCNNEAISIFPVNILHLFCLFELDDFKMQVNIGNVQFAFCIYLPPKVNLGIYVFFFFVFFPAFTLQQAAFLCCRSLQYGENFITFLYLVRHSALFDKKQIRMTPLFLLSVSA